ncbi:MAG: PDZ domain-containing protein [Gammaproteobacteria bacterium]|nr:PDZ domain-containing protein [Gammaproteobacteria bacterium]
MNHRRVQVGSLFVLSLVATVLLASGVPALIGPTTVAPLVEEVKDAVVNINATRSADFFGRRWSRRDSQAIGSGVIIDAENGYVVTNEHVIRGAKTVKVTLADEREFVATMIGADAATDVAVLQIPSEDLHALPLADSDETRVGDFVLAIGNPFGLLEHTVTSGIVSGLGRQGLGIEAIEDFIQTDAAINQGNSGGPLINFSGEIIGINTAILGPSGNLGIAFAIPSNLVSAIVDELVEFGGIARGYLGVGMDDIAPDEKEKIIRMYELDEVVGVLITRVEEGSAAFDAGIKADDIITSFNGNVVEQYPDLWRQINIAKIGEKVPIELLRDGELQTVYAEIRPKTWHVDWQYPFLAGATLRDINPQDEQFDELEGKGWFIQKLQPNSPASELELEVGDVITPLSGFRRDIDVIEIYRDGETQTISVP